MYEDTHLDNLETIGLVPIGLPFLDSSTLAWKIPWAEEPGRLQSMRSLRVGHYSATNIHTSDVQAHEGSRVQGRGEPEFGFWSSSPRSTSYYQ